MFILYSVIISASCNISNPQHEDINFDNLEKGYVTEIRKYSDRNSFFNDFDISESNYLKDSVEYFKTIQLIKSANTGIIGKLLKFEKNEKRCHWINPVNPVSSTIEDGDILSKSDAAKAIIDSYILGSEVMVYNSYIKEIEYSWLKKWYRNSSSKDSLKSRYIDYVRTVSPPR